MNTTTFEIKIRSKDLEKFQQYTHEKSGPVFLERESTAGYFESNPAYGIYYEKAWTDEVILYTVVPVYAEKVLFDWLLDAAADMQIQIKIICFYQDPGTGESSGGVVYAYGKMFVHGQTADGYVWINFMLKDKDDTLFYTPKELEVPEFNTVYDETIHGEIISLAKEAN